MIEYSVAERAFLAKFESLLKKRKDDEEAKRRQLKAKSSPLDFLNFGGSKKAAEPQKPAAPPPSSTESAAEPEAPKPDAKERLKQALLRQQQGLPPVQTTAPAAPVRKAPSAAKYRQPGAPPTPAHDASAGISSGLPASEDLAGLTGLSGAVASAPAYSRPPTAAPSYSRPPPTTATPAYSRPPTAAPAYSRPPSGAPASYSRPPPSGPPPSYSRPPPAGSALRPPGVPAAGAPAASTKRAADQQLPGAGAEPAAKRARAEGAE